jgi:hypothetical protein
MRSFASSEVSSSVTTNPITGAASQGLTTVATQRLIAASAALDPADRALLNLLVTRGLDNDSLARFSRVDTAAIVARRERIVHRLSDELGLPPDQVRGALDELAAAALQPPHAGNPATPPNGNGAPPATGAATSPGAATPDQAGPPERRFTRKRLVSAAVAGVGIVAVVVALLASASTRNPRQVPLAGSSAAPPTPTNLTPARAAPIVTPAHTKAPAQRRAAAGSPTRRLATLPGATSPATGSVALAGTSAHPRLTLHIKGLIAAHGGHYEAWLYNTILDSTPLVRLRDGVTSFTARLPHDYHRYRWIDISLQHQGTVNNSGESVMRAHVPAR